MHRKNSELKTFHRIINVLLISWNKKGLKLRDFWKILVATLYHILLFNYALRAFFSYIGHHIFLSLSGFFLICLPLASLYLLNYKANLLKDNLRRFQLLHGRFTHKKYEFPLKAKIAITMLILLPVFRGIVTGVAQRFLSSIDRRTLAGYLTFGQTLDDSTISCILIGFASVLNAIVVYTIPSWQILIFCIVCDYISQSLRGFNSALLKMESTKEVISAFFFTQSSMESFNSTFSGIAFILLFDNFCSMFNLICILMSSPLTLLGAEYIVWIIFNSFLPTVGLIHSAAALHEICREIKSSVRTLHRRVIVENSSSETEKLLKSVAEEDVFAFTTWGSLQLKKSFFIVSFGALLSYSMLFAHLPNSQV